MAKRNLPLVVLLLILLGLLLLKAQFEFGLGPRAHDADYYYDIARHVAQGQGLQSNMSLYFQGFQSFPHPVTQSPVWPIALGGVGWVFGIERVATALPNFFYFVDLILLYCLALRLQSRIADGRPGLLFREGRILNFGHAAVLLFATNVRFFRFTSVPNNEALAFFWIFVALIALDRAVERRSLASSFLAGLLGGLALLTRVQAAPAAAVVPLVLSLPRGDRSASFSSGAAALAGVLLPLIPWALHLSYLPGGLSFGGLLGMETQYETPELGVLSHTITLPGLWPTILDRMGGLLVAFDPRSDQSYVYHFNASAYLVPLAALHVGWAAIAAGRPARWTLPPRHALALAMVMMGGGMLLPVHMSHMAFSKEWLFGFRHGLPLLLLILPASAYLDVYAGRVFRFAAAALLGLGLLMNALDMKALSAEKFRTGLLPHEAELVRWLDVQIPTPKVVTTKPWELGTYSRSGYHWILCSSPPEQTLALIEHAGADHVVVFESDRRCRFLTGLHPERLEIAAVFGRGKLVVLKPKEPLRVPRDAER